MTSGSSTSSAESAGSGSGSKGRMVYKEKGDKFRAYLDNEKMSGVQGYSLYKTSGEMGTVNEERRLILDDSGASATSSSTRTLSRSTTGTSGSDTSQLTLDGSTPTPSQTLTSYARDFLASPTRWLGSGPAFKTLAANSSLRSQGLLRSDILAYCSLRTSSASSPANGEQPSEKSSQPWMRWGMMRSGRCLTASTLESRRTASGCSLSDILEESPGEKYFLSDKALKSLLAHDKRHREAGNGFGASIATITRAEPDR